MESKILISVCLFSSTLGLILIYIAVANIHPLETEISEIDYQLIGRTVKTSGYIVYRRTHPEGHIFLTISDEGRKIQVPLFAGFVNALSSNGLAENDLRKGTKISITGLIDEYKGQLQIIPRKPDDVKILGE